MSKADALLAAQLAEFGDDVLHAGAFDGPASGTLGEADKAGKFVWMQHVHAQLRLLQHGPASGTGLKEN